MDLLYRAYAAAFGRPSMYRINRMLFHLGLRGMGVLNHQNTYLSGEKSVVHRFIGNAPKGAVVVDVGANEGDWSALALQSNASIDLHAFEPMSATFERLQKRIDAKCHNTAVGAKSGEAFIYDYGEGTSHASLEPGVIERFHQRAAKRTTVPVVTLSDTIPGDKIYFLKIDVEGRELDVLKGLEAFFNRGGVVEYLQIEFNEMNILSRTFMDDLAAFLPGYRIYRILPKGHLLDITDEQPVVRDVFAFQNILFAKDI